MLNPNKEHIEAVQKIWNYLLKTETKGLTFVKGLSQVIKAYSDLDWGNCPDTARSTTGWVIMMAGSPISWSLKR